jgi:hypothetical protein
MNLGVKAERNLAMVEMYRDGSTLQIIGDALGVTSERVRQILRRADVPPREPMAKEIRTCPVCGAKHERAPYRRIVHCSRECGHRSSNYGPPASKIPRDTLVARLQSLGQRLGRTPSEADINADPDTFNHMTYFRRFGSVRAAQIAAGFKPNGVGGAAHVRNTEER